MSNKKYGDICIHPNIRKDTILIYIYEQGLSFFCYLNILENCKSIKDGNIVYKESYSDMRTIREKDVDTYRIPQNKSANIE